MPLYLLLVGLPVPLIVWGGGQALSVDAPPAFFSIGVAQALESPPVLTMAMYIAGLSAASGLMIVSTLALSGMVLNHVVLPLKTPPGIKVTSIAGCSGSNAY